MIIDLTNKQIKKSNGFVKVKVDAPDGRFGQGWREGGITYRTAIWEAKKCPEMITTIIDERPDEMPDDEGKDKEEV